MARRASSMASCSGPNSVAVTRGIEAEVVLEPVEDDVESSRALLPQRVERGAQREVGLAAVRVHTGNCGHASGQCRSRIPAPVVQHDDPRLRLRRSQPVHDARVQERALADAARPVEDGDRRRSQVGDDKVALGFTTEESCCILVGVAIAGEAQIRRRSGAGRRATALLSRQRHWPVGAGPRAD